MSDQFDPRLPSVEEVLAGSTQAGVAPPPGFLADVTADAAPVDEFTALETATAELRMARREMVDALEDARAAQLRRAEAARRLADAERAFDAAHKSVR